MKRGRRKKRRTKKKKRTNLTLMISLKARIMINRLPFVTIVNDNSIITFGNTDPQEFAGRHPWSLKHESRHLICVFFGYGRPNLDIHMPWSHVVTSIVI